MNWINKAIRRLKKPDQAHEKLQYAFTDLDGYRHYRFPSVTDLPVERWGKGQEFLTFLSRGLTGEELRALVYVAIAELENLVAGKKGSLVTAAAALKEILQRENIIMHTELMYQFVAVNHVREDEPVESYSDSYQQLKVDAYKAMVAKGGPHAFFFNQPCLARAGELMSLSESEWNEYWNQSLTEQKALKKKIEYLKSYRKSDSVPKTSKVV